MNGAIRKIKTAQKIYRESGANGLLCRGAFHVVRGGLAVSEAMARKLRIERDCLEDFYVNRRLAVRNRRFENIHQGRRGFVLGTGPSLNFQDLSLLKNEVTFCVSSFWKHPILAVWEPTYYFILDNGYFKDDLAHVATIRNIVKSCGRSTFFLPAAATRGRQVRQIFPEERTYYMSFAGFLHEDEFTWPSLHRHVPAVMNVVQMALLAALYMGCNPVYLSGCDHDFDVMRNNGLIPHFHAGATIDNASPSQDTEPPSLTYEFTHHMWKAYEVILEACSSRGVKVMNATAGGNLNVYERADYASLFGERASLARR